MELCVYPWGRDKREGETEENFSRKSLRKDGEFPQMLKREHTQISPRPRPPYTNIPVKLQGPSDVLVRFQS